MIWFLFFLISCTDKPRPIHVAEKLANEKISFDSLRKTACVYLVKQQELCDSLYHINEYQHWYYDQATGKLTFSSKGLPDLYIDYEEVGSVSLKSNTWLWSWDNSSIYQKVKSEIGQVRDFGVSRGNGFEKLVRPYWAADQSDGWEMTAVAAYMMKAKGAYRVPSADKKLYSFMIFKSIHRADTVKSQPSVTTR